MKKSLSILLILVLSLFCFNINAQDIPPCILGQVYVSEAHGAGDPEDYIEIYNSGAEDCSLAGFKLDDNESLSDLTFGDIIIESGGYWVGYQDAEGSFTSGIGSGGDWIFFSDGFSEPLVVILGESSGGSHSFTSDGISCITIPSPGSQNNDCAVYGCTDSFALNYSDLATFNDGSCEYVDANPCVLGTVYVSEASGSYTDGDFIELYNSGAEDCSLSGFMLDDNEALTDFTFGDVVISAGGYWLGFEDQEGSFGSGLSADGDIVVFSDGTSSLIVSLGISQFGLSHSFSIDGISCLTNPSPGSSNSNCEILGCLDTTACNYNSSVTIEDSESCIYALDNFDCDNNCIAELDCNGECGGTAFIDLCGVCDGGNSSCSSMPLFFSEYAEGSSNNKYLEIYNPTQVDVDLSDYAFPSVANAPSTLGEFEYWNSFPEGSIIPAGNVYVIAHPSADEAILAEADMTFNYLSNGDDGFALVWGVQNNYEVIDWLGDWLGDPGSGWMVAGEVAATKDHTLVRKCGIASGNTDWNLSAGTNEDDSEWIVFDQNTWTDLGFYNSVCDIELVIGCTDPTASNYQELATADDGSCLYLSPCVIGTVYVSEAHGSGDPEDYIELYNSGTEDCSLEGIMIDDSETMSDLTFGSVIISAGGYWIGYQDGEGSFTSGLSADGDYVYLSDGNNTLSVVVGPSSGLSHSYDEYGVSCLTSPTPGYANDDCAILGCTDSNAENFDESATFSDGSCTYSVDVPPCVLGTVYVSEAHGSGDPADYIELYNSGSEDCSLLGFMIDDSPSLSDLTFGNIVISAGGYWIGYEDASGSFSSGIGGSGDSIYLSDAEGNVLVVYTLDGDLGSTNFTSDGTGCSADPTPGLENTLCIEYLEGCTDSTALNYNIDAIIDNGLCEYDLSVLPCVIGTVYVTEAHGSGDPEDYIEIYNSGTEDCSLLGFMLDDEQPFGDLTFGDVVIPAGGYWLGYEDAEGSFGSGIGGGGDTVYFGDGTGNILMVETLDGDLGATNFTSDGTACSAEPTPGAANAECTVFVEG
ncbi:MAG: hypothetical protein CBD51_007385, partial [Flavobacteriales bacterium TMED191]